MYQFQVKLMEVASLDVPVLILGETGVGKGVAARALHALSPHCDGPFIQFDSGAVPESMIASELFGHEKGAFTNAVSRYLGRVEQAKGGTLFLDEISDMSLATQTMILRLLEDRTFERVGGSETLTAQMRIVAATNRNLEEMVGTGKFRADLYHRLYALPIYLPPLRERKEDIPHLAEFFKNRIAKHSGKQIDALTPEVMGVLQAYHWPGNVRELENVIQRAIILCDNSRIKVVDLEMMSIILSTYQDQEIVSLNEFKRRYILEVLKDANWHIEGAEGAAALLGLDPSTLYSKIKKLGIKRPE